MCSLKWQPCLRGFELQALHVLARTVAGAQVTGHSSGLAAAIQAVCPLYHDSVCPVSGIPTVPLHQQGIKGLASRNDSQEFLNAKPQACLHLQKELLIACTIHPSYPTSLLFRLQFLALTATLPFLKAVD